HSCTLLVLLSGRPSLRASGLLRSHLFANSALVIQRQDIPFGNSTRVAVGLLAGAIANAPRRLSVNWLHMSFAARSSSDFSAPDKIKQPQYDPESTADNRSKLNACNK